MPQPDEGPGSYTHHLLTELARGLRGTYDLLSILGQGGNGMVLEVRNRPLERLEALKLLLSPLDPEAAPRFEREAKLAASLEHPAIVPIYAFGTTGERRWFTMKLVEGPSLSRLISEHRRVEPALAVRLVLPILEALALSHARGIVHRDIKPENILVDGQGHPLLADFGIAKEERSPSLTMAGMMLGTPAYVSPEQVGGLELDGRTDLYALGVTLFQMVTGELPFSGGTSMHTLVRRMREDPPDARSLKPDLDPELSAIIRTAMAREREGRFPDAQAMAKALRESASRLGIDLSAPIPVGRESRPRRTTLRLDLPALDPGPQAAADLRPEPPGADSAAATLASRPFLWGSAGTAGPADPVHGGPAPPGGETSRMESRQMQASRRTGRRVLAGSGAALALGAALISMPWLFPRLRRASAAPVPAPRPESPAQAPAKPSPAPLQDPVRGNAPAPPTALAHAAESGQDRHPPPRRAKEPADEPAVLRPKVPPQQNSAAIAEQVDPSCRGIYVVVFVTVRDDGSVRTATVHDRPGLNSSCAEAAKQAAMKLTFKPAMDFQGRPMEATATISVSF